MLSAQWSEGKLNIVSKSTEPCLAIIDITHANGTKQQLVKAFVRGAGQISHPLKKKPLNVSLKSLKGYAPFAKANKRKLKPIDEANSHTPFVYDPSFMARLRPDQVPRFLGALTGQNKLPKHIFETDSLIAIQDRVNTAKVQAMLDENVKELPLVVDIHGKYYIADGHHRCSAAWLAGKKEISARYKDLTPISQAVKARRENPKEPEVTNLFELLFGVGTSR